MDNKKFELDENSLSSIAGGKTFDIEYITNNPKDMKNKKGTYVYLEKGKTYATKSTSQIFYPAKTGIYKVMENYTK